MLIGHPFLEGDYGIVGYGYALRTHLRAALGDVAVADAVIVLQIGSAVEGVERMHLELSRVNQEPRSDELLVQLMIAQDVTDILAEKALDAFSEFLHPVRVRLLHAPGPIGSVRRARRELPDPLLGPEVGRDIGHQIADKRKSTHGLDGHGL
jgi:hypothetical protein